MKRKLCFFLLFFFSCVFVKAMAVDVNAMTLWMSSGNQVTFLLDEMPVVTFQNDDLLIKTQMNVITYAANDVCKFTYSYVDPDGIASLSSDGVRFSIKENVLTAYDLEPLSDVDVYSTEGFRLAVARADRKGCVKVSLPMDSGKVIVVKTSVANFKVTKP